MSLLLALLSEGLIDDVEDDKLAISIRWTPGQRYESVEITLLCHGTNGSL